MFLTFCLHLLLKVTHICVSNLEKEISQRQNSGSKRHFAMKADKNSNIFKSYSFPKHFKGCTDSHLHFYTEEKDVGPSAH